MSWYRQYRPQQVQHLHSVAVRETIQGLLQRGNLPHAFLLTGPKGTGKTSLARILAALLNDPQNAQSVDASFFQKKTANIPSYKEPNPDTDIISRIFRGNSFAVTELDAASNRGIDDVRQLREKIFLPPAEGKISVYILDEVHMFTTEAFNALLKMLEEPPSHVVFILATTELHKVPATIVSRCTRIAFHQATPDELVAAMTQILKKEQISFEDHALELIAAAADGSFRDAVKLLEQIAQGRKKLTSADVEQTIHQVQPEQVAKLVTLIVQKEAGSITTFFAHLREQGVDPVAFAIALQQYLHTQLITALTTGEKNAALSAKVSHFLLSQFAPVIPLPTADIPFLPLELKALDLVFRAQAKTSNTDPTPKQPPLPPSMPPDSPPPTSSPTAKPASSSSPLPPPVKGEDTQQAVVSAHQVVEKWADVLSLITEKNSSLAAVMRSAKPVSWDGQTAQVEVYYQFHREQLQQPKFRQLLDDCVTHICGGSIGFEFLLAQSPALSSAQSPTDSPPVLADLAKEILV